MALGLTLPYVRAALLSSFAAGAVGLACVLAILRRWFGPAIALVTTLLVFAATPLVWYMVYEASMTHAASFGAVAALVFASVAWARPQGYTPAEARWLGTLAALAFLMRPQEALFAIVPAMLTAVALPASARLDALRQLFRQALIGAAPWLVLQAIHSTVLLRANDFQLFGQQGYLDPLAIAVARHAVLVVARPAVVDAGGLRGGPRHGGAVLADARLGDPHAWPCSWPWPGSTARPPTGPPAGRSAAGASPACW